AADFTGDGIPDLIAREADGELRLRPGNKDVDEAKAALTSGTQPKTSASSRPCSIADDKRQA
ncbi:hypothetical protein, partial [Streptomyces sp. NPDC000405]|uniref:hypothetical protein n=1 Tax=Streptomyces sp. NPDC000405 TaxID=3161033 RepID=UPI00398CBE5A